MIKWNTDHSRLAAAPISLEIFGKSYTGKTFLALTARPPIALLHCNERLAGTLDHEDFTNKDIRDFNYSAPGPLATEDPEDIMAATMPTIDSFFEAFNDALTPAIDSPFFGSPAKTIVIDTHSLLWQLMRSAYFGAESPDLAAGGGASSRIDVAWGGINERWRTIRTNWKKTHSAPNLIFIGEEKEIWVNNKSTGEFTSSGQKRMSGGYDSDIRIHTSVNPQGGFVGKVVKPGINDAVRGLALPNPTLPLILSSIYCNTPSDWE